MQSRLVASEQMSCLRVDSKVACYSINKALFKEVVTTIGQPSGTTLSQILHVFNQRSSRNVSHIPSQLACHLLDPFLFPSW